MTAILESDGESPKNLRGRCGVCEVDQDLWTDEAPDCVECGALGSVEFQPCAEEEVEYLDVVEYMEGSKS